MAQRNLLIQLGLVVSISSAALAPVTVVADIKQAEKAVRMQDFGAAIKLYQPLAEQGMAEAQYQLANLYLQGRGTSKNIVSAKRWLDASALQNYAPAQFGLAQLIADKEPERAQALIQAAAEQGHRAAQTLMARTTPIAASSDSTSIESQWFGAARNDDVPALDQLKNQHATIAISDRHGRNALFYAIEANANRSAPWLIKNGIDINRVDTFGITPLQVAIERKNETLIKLLIKAGAKTSVSLSNGDSLLHYALRLEQYNLVPTLLAAGTPLNQINHEGWTALDFAEYQKATKTAALLKSKGAQNGDGWRSQRTAQDVQTIAKQLSNANLPPAAMAVINDNESLLKSLVKSDKSVLDTRLNDDSTLVLLAIKHNKHRMLKTLIALGSNVLTPGYQDLSPLHVATAERDVKAIEILLSAGANPTQKDSAKRDVIVTAIESEQVDIANVLLDNLIGRGRSESEIRVHLKTSAVPVNQYILLATQHRQEIIIDRLLPFATSELAVDDQDRNALWFATEANNAKLILKLLKAGIPPDHEDNLGRTPFIVAVDNSCLECARQLSGFADINHQTKSGNTALMLAAAKGDSLICAWLIQNKADIEIRNIRGNTALMEAVNANSMDIVRLLLKADANVTRKNKLGFSAIDLARQTSPQMLELVKSKSVLGLF